VPSGVQAAEQLVQQHHLARGEHQAPRHVVVAARAQPVLLLRRLEQEGVVAALLQLSNDVE
jgi:hypothetical protein